MDSSKTPVIFILDKNQIHNSLIKYHLNVNRFSNVHAFASGNECLYRIEKSLRPDFIVMDYDTGDYNGFDFIKLVNTLSPDTKIIFFSSINEPLLAVRLLDAGATDYVAKTGKLEIGITELVKNLGFLIREEIHFKRN